MNANFEQLLANALGHDDQMVRSEALNLLAGCRHGNPTTTLGALRQLDVHGWHEAFEFSHHVTDLPHSEESMTWLADRLEKLAPETEPKELNHLVGWFCKAPVPLIRPHANRFMKTLMASLPPETQPIMSSPVKFTNPQVSFELAARRLEAACLTTNECLARMEVALAKCAESLDFASEEVIELDVLCEALGQREAVPTTVLIDWLDPFFEDSQETASLREYRAGAAVLILKHGRLPLPAPQLVTLFELDWDWLNEEVADTLSSAGDSSTLGFLLEEYPELPWSARLYLTGVFEQLRFPEHESALIAALDEEEDEDLAADLARTLVLYGSEKSLARAWEASKELFPSGERDALVDALRLHELLSKTPSKETLKHFEKLRKRMVRTRKRSARLKGGLMLGQPPGEDDFILPYIAPQPITTYRAEPQVGRNSLCPCDSGKKFKKCCGG